MQQTRLIANTLRLIKLRPTSHERSVSHTRKEDTSMMPQQVADINLDGRNCVLITDVFKRNVNNSIVEFQKRHNTAVTSAIFFDENTGLGVKPCLLLKLLNPLPWQKRIHRYKRAKDGRFYGRVYLPIDIVERRSLSPAILQQCEDISSQIIAVYENVSMSPQVCLYHSMVTAWLEDYLKEAYPDGFTGNLMPFGSAPCGLSLHGSSDLDIAFTNMGHNMERTEQVDILSNAGDHFKMMPGLSRVIYVLNAKVPILKFGVKSTNLSVDLSISHGDGIYFTQLFNFLKKHDERIFPLIFCLKFWSKINQLSSIPFSNFVLTTLVLFYLQQRKIIPPLKHFITDSATFCIDENVTYSKNLNTESLAELLKGFFQFYSMFNFSTHAVNLLEGTTEVRADKPTKFSTISIGNPFFPNCYAENIGRNVTKRKEEHFRKLCQLSLTTLRHEILIPRTKKEWGLNLILPCGLPKLNTDVSWTLSAEKSGGV